MYSQAQRQRSFYPNYPDPRSPSYQYRPQTSGGFSQSQGPTPNLNRSYHKMTQQNYNYPAPQRPNLSRSKVSLDNSQVSHLSNLAHEPEVFPE